MMQKSIKFAFFHAPPEICILLFVGNMQFEGDFHCSRNGISVGNFCYYRFCFLTWELPRRKNAVKKCTRF